MSIRLMIMESSALRTGRCHVGQALISSFWRLMVLINSSSGGKVRDSLRYFVMDKLADANFEMVE